jgi:hypothetical protein
MCDSQLIVPIAVGFFTPYFSFARTSLDSGFTYQGEIQQDGLPLDGTVLFQFNLWVSKEGGVMIGANQVSSNVSVTNGQFSAVLNMDNEFGDNAFNVEKHWLKIEVCLDPACDSSTLLYPRQPLTASPYSSYSLSKSWSGLTDVPDGFAHGVDNSGDPVWGNNGNNTSFNLGRVGVGSDTPNHLLRLSGGPAWTTN